MAALEWKDMTGAERAAHMRAHRRVKILPQMGEQPKQEMPHQMRPAETPNAMLEASEPFSFPTPPKPPKESDENAPVPVVEAEIEGLMEWGLPKYQEIYPRLTYDSIKPYLILACRGGRARFLRTKDATSLFIAEVTPMEPLLFVYQIFVVARVSTGNTYKEAFRLIRASERWANSIGAIGFEFGTALCSVNLRDSADFLKRLSVILPDGKTERWTKILRRPEVEASQISLGARMAAMGMTQPTS